MIGNPELRRHLWLELSAHRVIGMPIILGLVFLLAYFSSPNSVPWTALGAFGAITILWGSHLASESVLAEFRNATWDAQRRSAMTPWDQAWGRLVGAPIYAWYGGALSLAVFMISALALDFRHSVLPFLISAVAVAVFGHGLGVITALATTRVGRQTRSPVMLTFVLLSLIAVAGPQIRFLMDEGSVRWFGIEFSRLWFVVLSALMFAAWGVVGAWRMMAREMQERTLPAAWLAFALWLSLYLAGLMIGKDHRTADYMVLAGTMFFVALSMSASVVWFEPRDYVTWKRTLRRWQVGDLHRFFQEIPCWLATMPFALISAIVLVFHENSDFISSGFAGGEWSLALCIWLFAVRDISLLHFFGLSTKSNRAVVTTLVYLIVLYLILPGLLNSMRMQVVAKVFLPNPFDQPFAALGASFLNAGFGLGLLLYRWKERAGV